MGADNEKSVIKIVFPTLQVFKTGILWQGGNITSNPLGYYLIRMLTKKMVNKE